MLNQVQLRIYYFFKSIKSPFWLFILFGSLNLILIFFSYISVKSIIFIHDDLLLNSNFLRIVCYLILGYFSLLFMITASQLPKYFVLCCKYSKGKYFSVLFSCLTTFSTLYIYASFPLDIYLICSISIYFIPNLIIITTYFLDKKANYKNFKYKLKDEIIKKMDS